MNAYLTVQFRCVFCLVICYFKFKNYKYLVSFSFSVLVL